MVTYTPRIHDDAIVSIKFNDKGVITSSADRTIKVWDSRTLCLADNNLGGTAVHPLQILHGHEGSVNAIDFVGDTLVSASGDNTIKIWSILRGLCLKTVM